MLKRNWGIIVTIVVLFAVVAIITTIRKPVEYQAAGAFEVIRIPNIKQSEVNYYQYDNYYASEVSRSISDNIISWIGTASTVSEIYQKGGYPLPPVSIKDLSKSFTAKKKSDNSAVIDIAYSSQDELQSSRMIKAATDVLSKKVEEYNESDDSAHFRTRVSEPVVIAAPKTTALNAIIAGFLGLILSLGVVALRESIKK